MRRGNEHSLWLSKASGDATAPSQLKAPLRSSTTAGCLNILSLGKRCVEEGFSFEWKAGKKPVLISPDGQCFASDIEHYAPVFHTMEASSSSSTTVAAESGGRSPPAGSSDDKAVISDRRRTIPPGPFLTHFPTVYSMSSVTASEG